MIWLRLFLGEVCLEVKVKVIQMANKWLKWHQKNTINSQRMNKKEPAENNKQPVF